MTQSIQNLIILDLPEVGLIKSEFVYNYATQNEETEYDEGIQDSYTLEYFSSTDFLSLPQATRSQILSEGLPRYFSISIEKPVQGTNYDSAIPDLSFFGEFETLESAADMIITERSFSGDYFSGLRIQPSNKTLDLVNTVDAFFQIDRGSTEIRRSSLEKVQDFISSYQSSNFIFNEELKSKLVTAVGVINGSYFTITEAQSTLPGYTTLEHDMTIKSQIIGDFVRSTTFSPGFTYFDRLRASTNFAMQIQNTAQPATEEDSEELPGISDDKIIGFSFNTQESEGFKYKLVGYQVEQSHINASGQLVVDEIKYVDNVDVSELIFSKVLYNNTYSFDVRPVYLAQFYGHDEDSLENYSIYLLIAGNGKSIVKNSIETTAPSPPQDLEFTLTPEGLMINWSMGMETQRDIAGFHLYKRKHTSEPFMLVKCIDFFNGSTTKIEKVPSELFLQANMVKTFFIDSEFKKDSKYIYAVCGVDNRGQVSEYSEQLEISLVGQSLVPRLISQQGAPRAYPNYFLSKDTFLDNIKISGFGNLDIYFTPEFLKLLDSRVNDNLQTVEDILFDFTNDNAGQDRFLINIIDADLQKSKNIKIKLSNSIITDFESIEEAIISTFY